MLEVELRKSNMQNKLADYSSIGILSGVDKR
jgi:hypothetical protein